MLRLVQSIAFIYVLGLLIFTGKLSLWPLPIQLPLIPGLAILGFLFWWGFIQPLSKRERKQGEPSQVESLGRKQPSAPAAQAGRTAASRLCIECGKYYDGEPKFCPNCGKPIAVNR
jgi:membrane protein implicated in regulation of membrane protease activity